MTARTLLVATLAAIAVGLVIGTAIVLQRWKRGEPTERAEAWTKPDKALFEDMSPFLRGLLAFLLAAFGTLLPLMVPEWNATRIRTVVLAELTIAPLVLLFVAPRRFRGLGRLVAGFICVGCFSYLGYELLVDPSPAEGGSPGQPNVFNAARAVILLGLPAGWYAWRGRLV